MFVVRITHRWSTLFITSCQGTYQYDLFLTTFSLITWLRWSTPCSSAMKSQFFPFHNFIIWRWVTKPSQHLKGLIYLFSYFYQYGCAHSYIILWLLHPNLHSLNYCYKPIPHWLFYCSNCFSFSIRRSFWMGCIFLWYISIILFI